MATHPIAPLDTLLAVLPTLPRPLLARLTDRLIDRLNEIDGDPDLEEDDAAEDEHDREEIDEREPELYQGGYSDRSHPDQVRMGDLTAYSADPHPDMARIKRQLRAIKRRN